MRIYIILPDNLIKETKSFGSLGYLPFNLISPGLIDFLKRINLNDHEIYLSPQREIVEEFLDPLSIHINDSGISHPLLNTENYCKAENLESLQSKLSKEKIKKAPLSTPFSHFLSQLKDELISKKSKIKFDHSEHSESLKFESFAQCTLDLDDNDLLPVTISIFQSHKDCLDRLSIPEKELINFLSLVKDLYLDNPYHNYKHALDVLQCTSHIIKDERLKSFLRDIDVLAILIASICHDIAHLGVNNAFLRNYSVDIALIYNGISPLENYHSFLTNFIIEYVPDCNLTKNWDETLIDEFRRLICDAILATDMANHSRYMTLFRSDVLLQDKGVFLSLILKASDLSNIVRPTCHSQRWSGCLLSEFYRQGRKERSLGCSPKLKYMDEERDDFASGQVYFLETFAKPLFDILVDHFRSLEYLRSNLLKNINAWKERVRLENAAKIEK